MALGNEQSNTAVKTLSPTMLSIVGMLSVVVGIYGMALGAACHTYRLGFIALILYPDSVFMMALTNIVNIPFIVNGGWDSFEFALIGFFTPWALVLATILMQKRDYMYNKEHGSARWGTQAESDAFADLTDEYNNIIFSDSDRMVLTPKGFNIHTDRNKNVLIIGGPGSGKTRYIMKPNMLQLNSTFVVSDPKGTLPPEVASLFAGDGETVPEECLFVCPNDLYKYEKDASGRVTKKLAHKKGDKIPYRLKVLNLIDFYKSNRYNPLAYMKSGKDILKLTNVFMKNSQGDGTSKGEDFWEKAEALFYQAIFGYLYFCCPPSARNFNTVLDMVNMAEAKEEDESYKSPLDYLFEFVETGKQYNVRTGEWEQISTPDPDNFAVRQYAKFKKAAGKTLKSILISCAARLAIFEEAEVRNLMAADELELDTLGDYPTVLFLIIPDTDKQTFKAISAMCLYQMFDLLCAHADNNCGGKLAIPVQCLLDEFANLGGIPDFDCLITTVRSRNISAQIVLQNAGQLDRDYDKAARIIKGGCDTTVYLGKADSETCKEMSERMGKRTIAAKNLSKSQGQSNSVSSSDQLIQRELEDPSEVERMNATECRVLISGSFPQRSKKYDLTRHPRYKYIDPGHDGAVYTEAFDMRTYIERNRAKVRAEKPAHGLYTAEEEAEIRAAHERHKSRNRRVVRDSSGRAVEIQIATDAARELLAKESNSLAAA